MKETKKKPRGWSKPSEEVAALEKERNTMDRLMQEHQKENERKESEIRKLGEKFERVQKGLARMEKERKASNASKEKAEKENIHLRKLLQIRDKELQALNLQIATGTSTGNNCGDAASEVETIIQDLDVPNSIDVPRSSAHMALPDNHVTKMMTNLELQLSLRDEHVSTLLDELNKMKNQTRDALALERMLRESEGQQTLVRSQLERVEKDYVEVMESLSRCFENMKAMTASYKAKEAERTEIIWEANRLLIQQRASYMKNCQKMANQLFEQEQRILELEALAGSGDQDERYFDTAEQGKVLPLEKLVLDNSRSSALSYMEIQHEKELERLKKEHNEALREAKLEGTRLISQLNISLLARENEVASLKEDAKMHVDHIMALNTEINELRAAAKSIRDSYAAPSLSEEPDQAFIDRIKEEHRRLEEEIDASTFSLASDCEGEVGKLFNAGELDDASSRIQSVTTVASGTDRIFESGRRNEGRAVVARKMITGVVAEDGSVSGLERVAFPTLGEGCVFLKQTEPSDLGIEAERSAMLLKLSEASEIIQNLERRVESEESTVNLLRVNIEMMEQALEDKNIRIKKLNLERNQSNSPSRSSDTLSPDEFDLISNLQTELEVARDNFQAEKIIMQGAIRVLNDQLYYAINAVERDRQKLVEGNWRNLPRVEEVEDTNDRIADLEHDLDELHKKSQLALQLSQAEVAALKNRLDDVQDDEGRVLGLDWLFKHQNPAPESNPPKSSISSVASTTAHSASKTVVSTTTV